MFIYGDSVKDAVAILYLVDRRVCADWDKGSKKLSDKILKDLGLERKEVEDAVDAVLEYCKADKGFENRPLSIEIKSGTDIVAVWSSGYKRYYSFKDED